jgi:hypothetical protein
MDICLNKIKFTVCLFVCWKIEEGNMYLKLRFEFVKVGGYDFPCPRDVLETVISFFKWPFVRIDLDMSVVEHET